MSISPSSDALRHLDPEQRLTVQPRYPRAGNGRFSRHQTERHGRHRETRLREPKGPHLPSVGEGRRRSFTFTCQHRKSRSSPSHPHKTGSRKPAVGAITSSFRSPGTRSHRRAARHLRAALVPHPGRGAAGHGRSRFVRAPRSYQRTPPRPAMNPAPSRPEGEGLRRGRAAHGP